MSHNLAQCQTLAKRAAAAGAKVGPSFSVENSWETTFIASTMMLCLSTNIRDHVFLACSLPISMASAAVRVCRPYERDTAAYCDLVPIL